MLRSPLLVVVKDALEPRSTRMFGSRVIPETMKVWRRRLPKRNPFGRLIEDYEEKHALHNLHTTFVRKYSRKADISQHTEQELKADGMSLFSFPLAPSQTLILTDNYVQIFTKLVLETTWMAIGRTPWAT